MTRHLAFVLALLSGLPVAGRAEDTSALPRTATAVSPIFGQLVAFSFPLNFVAGFEEAKNGFYIREAVLKGETVRQWSQMITVTGAQGAAAAPAFSPQGMASRMAAGFRNGCPETFISKPIEIGRLGSHEASAIVAGCGRVQSAADGHSEIALIVTIKGSRDAYTLQWAERGATMATPVIDDAKWQGRLRTLMPIRLCPIKPGEAAPYPSCTAS